MKKNIARILIGLALVARLSAAAPTLNDLLRSAEKQIQAAGHHNDAAALDQATLALDKAAVLAPKDAWLWYYKGYDAYTRAALANARNDRDAEEKALTEADSDLQKSIESNRTGEALALHASVLGMLIQVRGPESGMQLGPQAGQDLDEARQLAPQSPQVLYSAGVSALFTPPEYGGDVHEAEKLLTSAAAGYATQPPAPRPTWGEADVHVFLGLVEQKLGDNAKAKAEFEKALAIDPDFRWVKYVLLPQVGVPPQK